MDELFYWLSLSRVDGVGSATMTRLVDFFGSPQKVLSAKRDELIEAGVKSSIIEALLKSHDFSPVEKELKSLEEKGIRIVTYKNHQYPSRLKEISGYPPFLYVWGHLDMGEPGEWIGVVGSRHCSEYGMRACEYLVEGLVGAGIGIASGFARGIDLTAHQAAVHGSGKTIAVLGGGLNHVYPAAHRRFVDEFLKKGVLISEFPLDEKPRPEYFPRRNRIISGLSRGVLVIEAAFESGALITAEYALEQNRDVFVVPGSIFSQTSRGCHRLIQQGAKLVSSVQDILDDWKYGSVKAVSTRPLLPPEEESIYRFCSENGSTTDEIIEKTGLPSDRVMVLLTKMELDGKIKGLPGKRYRAS